LSAGKRRGTDAESAVVRFFREHGYPRAERRALAGNLDRGDIVNGPPGFAFEVKAARRLAHQEWLREAEAERVNAGERFGAVIHKPVGVADAAGYHVVMRLDAFVDLLGTR
jgi:Holliday junction resolvase